MHNELFYLAKIFVKLHGESVQAAQHFTSFFASESLGYQSMYFIHLLLFHFGFDYQTFESVPKFILGMKFQPIQFSISGSGP